MQVKAEEIKLENQKIEAQLKLDYIETKLLLEQGTAEYKVATDLLQELRKKKREVAQQLGMPLCSSLHLLCPPILSHLFFVSYNEDQILVAHNSGKIKFQKSYDEHHKSEKM